MSFTRYMLANWRIAYVPKVGVTYRDASTGPFELGPIATPKQLKQGYVLYDMTHENGHKHEMVTTFGVFASMYRES